MAVLLAFLLTPLSPTLAQGLWWRVEGADGQTGYLGGSIHVGSEAMYPLPEAVMVAFRQADVLVVEIDILNTGVLEVLGKLLREGVYLDGTTLESRLDTETWALLEQVLAEFELPEWMFRWQKPWFAALNISLLAFREAGYREDLGVDHFFLESAAASDKPVLELETVEQQLRLFSRLSATEQEMFLRQTLLDLEQGPHYLAAIIAAWQAGDSEAMAQLILQQFDTPSAEGGRLHRLFIEDRNRTMAEGVQAVMEDGSTPFVVVGAGHLVGATGLVALFREAGYRVKPLAGTSASLAETP